MGSLTSQPNFSSPASCLCRYTQFVSLFSRPVQARLDLGPLAKALNRRAPPSIHEAIVGGLGREADVCKSVDNWLLTVDWHSLPGRWLASCRVDTGREEGVQWASNSLVDTGPLLR